MINIEHFSSVEIKVGIITEIDNVEGSDQLYKLMIDLGEEKSRTILSKIAKFYTQEELLNKQVCVVTNLQKRRIMGIESEGMILMANADNRPEIISPVVKVPTGTAIF